MIDKFGIIITVENYQSRSFGKLRKVDYANADGDLVQEIFINKLGIAPDHVIRVRDDEFTCASFKAEIAYHFKQLSPGSTLYFYYAGHGFFVDGRNYLSTYETFKLDLKETSIPFEDIILEGFRSSQARTLIAFIDACAQGISDGSRSISTRGFGYNLLDSDSNRDGFNYAVFFACSPEERSYPSDKLKHGIWTWHLGKAFSYEQNEYGIEPNITAEYLKSFLHDKVLDYIRRNPDENIERQTPYAIISSNGDTVIAERNPKSKTFEVCIEELEAVFFNNCFVADLEYCIVDDMDPCHYDYTKAIAICDYLSKYRNLPYGWQTVVNKLQFYCNRIQNNESIRISHNEQLAILEEIEWLLDSMKVTPWD